MSVDTNTMVSNTQAIDFSKAEQEKIASTEVIKKDSSKNKKTKY